MTFERIGIAAGKAPDVANVVRAPSQPTVTAAELSQAKLKFALVDSGMGGGMTAALLRGVVRQLGSYFCLPIGEKTPHIATAYTAAMALWPLIAPLADYHGTMDGRLADTVIIACNSASVRREGAIDLMTSFCAQVAADDGTAYRLNPQIRDNIIRLHEEIRSDSRYLGTHVREIVTETAKSGVDSVRDLFKRGRTSAFVRIDSTNGTADSGIYPSRIEEQLRSIADGGSVNRSSFQGKLHEGADDYVVNHDIYTCCVDGRSRTVIVESRGNPPWVAAIEANRIDAAGADLVNASARVSHSAIDALGQNPAFLDFVSRSGQESDIADAMRALEAGKRSPDVSMLCCTHYPAMKPFLEDRYRSADPDGAVRFINQATVVKQIVEALDPEADDPGRGDLHLALTVGSQNYGGTPGHLKPSVGNGNATARTLFKVLDTTLASSQPERQLTNDIRQIGSVRVFQQGQPGEPETVNPARIESLATFGVLQQQFELIHQYIGQPLKAQILAEQYLVEVPNPKPDEPRYRLLPAAQGFPIQPRIGEAEKPIMARFSPTFRSRINRLGSLMTLGEARGIDKLAPYNDQGQQLRAAAARILEVAARNDGKAVVERERVGILTGFSVIDNKSRSRVGGENDGPPGAVVMARTLLQRGLPVTLVTDRSGEASLVSALLGSGLVTLVSGAQAKSAGERRVTDLRMIEFAARDMLRIEVPDFDNVTPGEASSDRAQRDARARAAVMATAGRLRDTAVTTMISIERPSVTAGGHMTSMLGLDVSRFNLDMSPLLGFGSASADDRPFTIGIGDGGNELGTGGIATITAKGRDEKLQPFVRRGDFIAADPKLATDVMLLSTVSNNGGVALAMSIDAAYRDGREGPADPVGLRKDVEMTVHTYNDIITSMHREGMSLDGVSKVNLLTVDGRRLGSVAQAAARYDDFQARGKVVPLGIGPTGAEGADDDTTHNDTFLKFRNIVAPLNPAAGASPLRSRL